MKLKVIAVIGLFVFALIASCQSDQQVEFQRYYTAGSLTYQTRCQNCHGNNGEGLQALIPPLTDSVFLKTNRDMLACYVKFGLKAKITISNRPFDDTMPANDLSPVDLANVLTYVTNSFGNKLGVMTTEDVDNYLEKCR